MKRYFQSFKFNGGYHLRTIFQQELSEALAELDYDWLVPIPVSEATMQTRGFNQTVALLEGHDIKEVLCCLEKDKTPQSSRRRSERLQAPQPFELSVSENMVKGLRICLVDDVYTTGMTMRHAARCFYDAGAKQVCAITLCR
jgi:competence protein ComFC